MIALVILDGLGDFNKYSNSGRSDSDDSLVSNVVTDGTGVTPLQRAHTPTLDAMLRQETGHGDGDANGVKRRDVYYGTYDPVRPGLACGSDTAHLNILGFPPHVHYAGRGCLEALGAGLPVETGDIAFKSNFASSVIDPETGKETVVLRRVDRRFEVEGPILCAALDGMPIPGYPNHKILIKYATEHRCGVVVRGPGLTDTITGTDPLKDGREIVVCRPSSGFEEDTDAQFTSGVINAAHKAIQEALLAHPINTHDRVPNGKPPANTILFRGAGMRKTMPPFPMKGFTIAPTCIISGLAKLIGLDVHVAPRATGDYHTDLTSKVETFLKHAPDYEFGLLHIKNIDDAGHDGSDALKTRLIEKADLEVISVLRRRLPSGSVIIVTGDHSTPCVITDHSCDAVPFIIERTFKAQTTTSAAASATTTAVHDGLRFDELGASRSWPGQPHNVHFLGRFLGESIMPFAVHLWKTA
eukprot:PhM_4_TR17638/c0_g1_i1/m.44036